LPENEQNPPDKRSDPEPGAVDEIEIDRVLREARGLTDELKEQVGESPTQPGSLADLASVSEASNPPDVDQQLSEIEAILSEVVDQPAALNETAQAESQDGPELEDGPDPAKTPEPEDLPDEIAVASLADSIEISEEVSPAIEIVDAPKEAPPAGSKGDPSPTGPSVDAEAEEGRGDERESEPLDEDEESAEPSRSSSILERLRRAAGILPHPWEIGVSLAAMGTLGLRKSVDVTLRSLDAIDGAMTFVNYKTRYVLGLLAMALLTASLAIFAFSWLA
jgi:hypothetical protein